MSRGMRSLRLSAKHSPKKLAFEDFGGQDCSLGGETALPSSPKHEAVDLKSDVVAREADEFEVLLSPPKSSSRGRKRSQTQCEFTEFLAANPRHDLPSSQSPGPPKAKLTWQSRHPPEHCHHRRSPPLTRIHSDNSHFDSAPDPATPRNLQQSTSFSGGDKEGENNSKAGHGSLKGGTDNVPSNARASRNGGGRPPMNNELNTNTNSLGSVTSAATPKSAGRSLRYGGASSSGNSLAGVGVASTRTTGVGNGGRMLVPAQRSNEPQFELEEDPTFWQDHNVQVLIRARPISACESAQHGYGRCVKQESAHTIAWLGQPESRFTFDHVAGEAITQEELFQVAGLPMVENCMAGYNSCMFAYGQTGSGKTHTMLGDLADLDHQPSDNRGITPRVFESLFSKIQAEEETQKHDRLKYVCKCSFLEIYNEQITDLLEPSSSNLQMREDANKGVYVEGLLEVEVQNVHDVLHLLLLGAANRRVAATNMNRESSRSHSVFTCIIESQWESDSMINFRFGRLNLVDLAGSERQKASGAEGDRLKEAASINKSLSTLGLVIMVLVDIANGKQRHVPYRDSKLTFLLQDSLGGNSKTIIIANISPSSCAALETVSTLKFAQRAKFIRNNAVVNEDASGDINGLRQQIQLLKEELARLRRQSISRIPTVRTSGSFQTGILEVGSTSSPTNGPEPPIRAREGSFLQFGRTLLSPTVLNKKIKALEAVLVGALRREQAAEFSIKRTAAEIEHLNRLVKQREDETQCSKLVLRFRENKIRRLEGLTEKILTPESYLLEEKNAAVEELQLARDVKVRNPELTRFATENIRLQAQLRRFQDIDIDGEREALTHEISALRDQLVEMLESNLSVDSVAHAQNDASSAKLAAEIVELDLLRIEVETYRKDLEECHKNLRSCLESNEKMASQVDVLQADLDNASEECSKQKEELEKLREKALEVDHLELKEAQHQQFMVELKSQLQKSEKKAKLEASKRCDVEQQLTQALQESTNLQADLQWTKHSLDAAEKLGDKLLQSDQSSEMGEGQTCDVSLSQANVIEQLQLELLTVKAALEGEQMRGRGLEEQIAGHSKQEDQTQISHMRRESSESYEGHTRVRHHDAILQLQMELDSIDGAPESAIKSYRWEEGTRDEIDTISEVEVKHSMTIMQLQLDFETLEGNLEDERKHLREVEATNESLRKRLDEMLVELNAEKAVVETLGQQIITTDLESLQAEHLKVLEKLKMREERDVQLKQRISQLEWELTKEQEFRSVESELNNRNEQDFMDETEKFTLKEKLKRAALELKKTQNITFKSQGEKAFKAALEQEMDVTRSQAKSETAFTLTSMQSELAELRDVVAGAMSREAVAQEAVVKLSKELANMNIVLKDVQENHDGLLNEKAAEIRALRRDWEGAAARLIDYLAMGELSLDDPFQDKMFGTSSSRSNKVRQSRLAQKVVEEQKAVESLQKQLHDARKIASSAGDKVRALGAATLKELPSDGIDETLIDPSIQVYENINFLKIEMEVCDGKLRELERKSTVAFIMVWWLSETAGLRQLAEDRTRVELTEAVAKIQERESVLFSLQLEHERTPEKEPRVIQMEALTLREELATWKEEVKQLAAENEKFEMQVRESANMLEDLREELERAGRRLQVVDSKACEMANAQSGLAVAEEYCKAERFMLVTAATKAEKRYLEVGTELKVTKAELRRLEDQKHEAEARETAMQDERAKLEVELKTHSEAVQILTDALKGQLEMKEEEIVKLKERVAEQYEEQVLKRSDLLEAAQEADARCMEKDQTSVYMPENFSSLQGRVSSAGYAENAFLSELEDLPDPEAKLQLQDKVSEMARAMDCLTTKNMELQMEKNSLGDDMEGARLFITQKEEEFASLKTKLTEVEKSGKQAEERMEALTMLMDQFACSEGNWISERESLNAEMDNLKSCLVTKALKFSSQQGAREDCEIRLITNQEQLEGTKVSKKSKRSKVAELELAKTCTFLAASEEKVKLLMEAIATMSEDWARERESLISEKDVLQMELAWWEQHIDLRRNNDQPLRTLSENRSVPAADGHNNSKHLDKLRQEVERTRSESGKLRTKVREKDSRILAVQMDLSQAVANCKKLEVEMQNLIEEKEETTVTLKALMEELQPAEGEVCRRKQQVSAGELELERLTTMLLETEERMNAAEQRWSVERLQLETEKEEAKLEANEKQYEAAAMLVKFEEWQTTLREADLLVNALVRANEKAKQRWKRERERVESGQAAQTNEVLREMLETVAVAKEQVDITMSYIEVEMQGLVAEIKTLETELKQEISNLKGEKPGSTGEASEVLPSIKCLEGERRSWEQQFKAATTVLAEKEATIGGLQAEVDRSHRQAVMAQTSQSETFKTLQEKEEMVVKLVNELNHQNGHNDTAVRLSQQKDPEMHQTLRRSFSCKLIEEKETTLSVLKEEQEYLKTMVFTLETENAELLQQLQEVESKATGMESTIAVLRNELQVNNGRMAEEVTILVEQLEERKRHVNELECHRMELREEMQQQAVSFAELYEQLQRQENALEGDARTIASKVSEEKEVLRTLEEEKAELKSMVERLDAELTVYEKKSAVAETSLVEMERLRSEMEVIQKELTAMEILQNEIDNQNKKLETMANKKIKLEADLAQKSREMSVIGEELHYVKASATSAAQESANLRGQVVNLQVKTSSLEEELETERRSVEALEAELLTVEETMARFLEDATLDLKELETDRDKLQNEMLLLRDQLYMAQVLADEREAVAAEARQIAELSKLHAEEKEVEAEILGRSVEELESTVFALESQLGLLKRETERQRLMREDMEMELQGLKNHVSIMQAALDEAGARSAEELLEAQSAREAAERRLEEKEAEMELAHKNLEQLQFDAEEKAEKIQNSKVQISDVLAEGEKKVAEYEQKLKALESKVEERVKSQPTTPSKLKFKGAGSTFKCIGMGHQVHSELDEERLSYEYRIQELETNLASRQKEVTTLNRKLDDAERMTHDVLRDLLGVKLDMTNVATLLGQQQAEQQAGQAYSKLPGAQNNDEDLESLLSQLNHFIEERESWLEEISRRQADLLATRVAADKLQEREQVLLAENDVMKVEKKDQQMRIGDLEQEINKLSGQQNLQQRIQHHVKIKDENILLRLQNVELSGKLRRAELLFARVNNELAKYRAAECKTPFLNFDEEQLLRNKLQEAEVNRVQMAQKLASLCSSAMRAAGMSDADRNAEPTMALEAIHQLKIRLESTQQELVDFKLKTKIAEEKQRLNELRNIQSPMKSIGNISAQPTPR